MTTPIEPGHIVTLGDMFNELRDVHDTVSGLAQKIDGLPTSVADHEGRLRTLESAGLTDVDIRVTSLERARWMTAGITATISSLFSSGIVVILFNATHHH